MLLDFGLYFCCLLFTIINNILHFSRNLSNLNYVLLLIYYNIIIVIIIIIIVIIIIVIYHQNQDHLFLSYYCNNFHIYIDQCSLIQHYNTHNISFYNQISCNYILFQLDFGVDPYFILSYHPIKLIYIIKIINQTLFYYKGNALILNQLFESSFI